jgi:Trp operon repressor
MSTFKEKMMAKKIKKIKSLEEENKKLEARIVHLLNDKVQKRIYNDLLDNNMYQEGIIEDLKEQIAQLKTRGPDIWKKGIVGVEKSEFDNMKTTLEVRERVHEENKKLKEENQVLKQNAKNHSDVVDYWRNENEKLKEEQFDNMEEIAKRDGMCLVDIHIFDKLVEEEEENKEIKKEIKKLKEEKGKFHKDKRITVRSCDDRAEYNRQVMFLKSNPECKFIPERKWTKKSKDQPLEIS